MGRRAALGSTGRSGGGRRQPAVPLFNIIDVCACVLQSALGGWIGNRI
jgi:hypothetical protein